MNHRIYKDKGWEISSRRERVGNKFQKGDGSQTVRDFTPLNCNPSEIREPRCPRHGSGQSRTLHCTFCPEWEGSKRTVPCAMSTSTHPRAGGTKPRELPGSSVCAKLHFLPQSLPSNELLPTQASPHSMLRPRSQLPTSRVAVLL